MSFAATATGATAPASYHVPATLEEALALLAAGGTPLAGGQDLVPQLTHGQAAPSAIVDLRALTALKALDASGAELVVGALVTHTQLERAVGLAPGWSLLAEAASRIGGGPQVRNFGTIGGAVCEARSAGDYLPCLVALGARVRLSRAGGATRELPVAELLPDGLAPGELLTAVIVPRQAGAARAAYEKLVFSDGCYGIASVACVVTVNEGRVAAVSLVAGAATAGPLRLAAAEAALVGRPLDADALAAAAAAAVAAITSPLDDALADGAYRRRMVGVLVRRALVRCAA